MKTALPEDVFGLCAELHSLGTRDDTSSILETARYYWRYWERYRRVPSGCYARSWKEPNFFVCAGRLSASKRAVRDAFELFDREFDHVRVNSRKEDWAVIDDDSVSDRAAPWTLELGDGCSRPGDDGPEQVCLVIAIDNVRR